jgi:hypothetical protein
VYKFQQIKNNNKNDANRAAAFPSPGTTGDSGSPVFISDFLFHCQKQPRKDERDGGRKSRYLPRAKRIFIPTKTNY